MTKIERFSQLLDLYRHTYSYTDKAKILDAMMSLGSYEQLLGLYKGTRNSGIKAKIRDAMIRKGSYEQLLKLRDNTNNLKVRAIILDAMLEKTRRKKEPSFRPVHEDENKNADLENISGKQYDVFIAHASEDKDFANPLANSLEQNGIKVWYDDFILKLGDSLQQEIDRGLVNSRYGVVILSHNFFNKHWPQKELDGLAAKGKLGEKVILPIWRNLTKAEVLSYSPTLAGLVATNTRMGFVAITREIKDIVLS